MPNRKSKPLRILYAAGPGNVFGTYKHWIRGQDDPSQVSITFSSQFYDVCRALGAQGYIISSHQEKIFFCDGQFKIEHRPHPLFHTSGILYHVGQVWYGLGLVVSALLWQADVVVVYEGSVHWFVLSVLPLLGVKVVPSLHCVLWRKYLPRKKIENLICRLNHYLFANSSAILVASSDISEQVEQTIGCQHRSTIEFLPIYRREEFSDVAPPNRNQLPFRVLFIGRIEQNKGVFDLLDIAKRFSSEGRADIQFDICGSGEALESLRLAAKDSGLDSSFVCHGYCNKPQMREILSQAHVVIAPTTTAFVEGFCQVVAEGILAGRPVVTSSVVPALSYVRPGVVEVQPDDSKGYGDALLKLYGDREFYEQKRQGCFEVQEQFYDTSKGWGAGLESILRTLQAKGVTITERSTPQMI